LSGGEGGGGWLGSNGGLVLGAIFPDLET